MTDPDRQGTRRVAVMESAAYGRAISEAPGARADVAVAVVRPGASVVPSGDAVRRATAGADCVVVLVVGPSDGPLPDLAGLREVADVIAHVGADEQAVGDIVAALQGTGRVG